VRDLVLRERLEALARDAAERLRELVDSGEEVPFEIAGPAEGTPFSQYVPLTDRFVREQDAVIADLGSFSGACAALRQASLAPTYLEQLGEPVPPSEHRRAEAAAIVFLARLWEGCSEFTLDRDRLDSTLGELEGCEETTDGEAEVVAPLIGFHMPTTRLALAAATLVRADVVEVPEEVRRPEGTRRSAWEPHFLAVVRAPVSVPENSEPGERRVEPAPPGAAIRELVTTLRLFKAGGVGLGPYAWARTPRDRWRRLATGAPRPRGGGYRLTDSELGDLAALSRAVGNRSTPFGGPSPERSGAGGALARAISRFEAGLERSAMLEALSDYVLALRCLLDGGGAADVGLPMRVAALCAQGDERTAVKAQVERALELERTLMRGELPRGAHERPLELIAALEERTRSLLRGAVCGRLGMDLRAAADEALLADGLSVGEGAADVRGTTAEWGPVEPQTSPVEPQTSPVEPQTSPVEPQTRRVEHASIEEEETEMEEIAAGRQTTIVMATDLDSEGREIAEKAPPPPDWLSEVDSSGETLDWPERPEALKLLDRRPAERERARRRVRHLFPRPETTEWRVAELQYERRRARV
jgi:hypothetical protein